MSARKKDTVPANIQAKAKQILEFAEQKAKEVSDWVELHNALFGIAGKATEMFPTESERTAFSRTTEADKVFALFDTLPAPAPKEFGKMTASANGAISVRLPRSAHVALLAEAKAEGVSLNQLCVANTFRRLTVEVAR